MTNTINITLTDKSYAQTATVREGGYTSCITVWKDKDTGELKADHTRVFHRNHRNR
jgi:hypothetical protein